MTPKTLTWAIEEELEQQGYTLTHHAGLTILTNTHTQHNFYIHDNILNLTKPAGHTGPHKETTIDLTHPNSIQQLLDTIGPPQQCQTTSPT